MAFPWASVMDWPRRRAPPVPRKLAGLQGITGALGMGEPFPSLSTAVMGVVSRSWPSWGARSSRAVGPAAEAVAATPRVNRGASVAPRAIRSRPLFTTIPHPPGCSSRPRPPAPGSLAQTHRLPPGHLDRLLFMVLRHLPDGDNGEELDEDGDKQGEPGQGPRHDGPLHPGGGVGGWLIGHEGHPQPGYNDEVALHPHAGHHQNRRRHHALDIAGPGEQDKQTRES